MRAVGGSPTLCTIVWVFALSSTFLALWLQRGICTPVLLVAYPQPLCARTGELPGRVGWRSRPPSSRVEKKEAHPSVINHTTMRGPIGELLQNLEVSLQGFADFSRMLHASAKRCFHDVSSSWHFCARFLHSVAYLCRFGKNVAQLCPRSLHDSASFCILLQIR